MPGNPDRAAVKLLAVIASEEEWYTIVSVESVGDARKTAFVRDLRIEPEALVQAAEQIRASRDAYEQVRRLMSDECPSPPCLYSLSGVVLELLRLYYELRTAGQTAGA